MGVHGTQVIGVGRLINRESAAAFLVDHQSCSYL